MTEKLKGGDFLFQRKTVFFFFQSTSKLSEMRHAQLWRFRGLLSFSDDLSAVKEITHYTST